MLSRFALTVLVASVLTRAAVSAQALPNEEERAMPAQIIVSAPSCGLELEQTVELLRAELAGDGVDEVSLNVPREPEPSVQPPIAVIQVTPVPCQHDAAELEVTIDDLVTRKQLKRVLVVDTTSAEARPRALALGIAELLRASWAELSWAASTQQSPFSAWVRRRLRVVAAAHSTAADLDEPVSPDPVPASHAEVEPPTAGDDSEPFRAHAGFVVRTFPSGGASLLGGTVGAAIPFGGLPIAARVAVVAVLGRSEVRAGDITLGQVSLAVGLDLVSEGGAPMSIAAGPVAEFGLSTASGEARAGSLAASGSTATVLVGAHVMMRARVLGPVEAILDLVGGYAVRGLEATVDGDSTNGLVGAHLDAVIGIAISPDRWSGT